MLLAGAGCPLALAASDPTDLQRQFVTAVQTGRVEAVQALIEQGLDPDAPMEAFDGMTPLVITAMSGRADLLKKVLQAGVDVNRAAAGGMTPLEAGVASDDPVTVGLLLDAGAEVTEGIEFALKIAPGKNAARIQDLISRHGGSSRPGSGGGDGPPETPESGEPDEGEAPVAEAPEAEVIETSGTYPPGTYTGPCGSEFKDAPPGDTKPGDRGRSRSVATVFSDPLRESDEVDPDLDPEIARLLALAPLHEVKPPGCKPYEMGEGDYNVYVREVTQAWTWVCPGGLDECVYMHKEEEAPQASLRKAAQVKIRRDADRPDKDKPDVEITAPAEGAQFAFRGGGTYGSFTIDATATVSPARLASQVKWELEAIGGAKVTINPPTGDQVRITVEGLPEQSTDFGIKALTARIPGDDDQMSVTVFFMPLQVNHPGAGAGETPNWFHYWRQTSAGRDYDRLLVYRPAAPCSGGAQGNYFHDKRRIFLYDKLYMASCRRRVQFVDGRPVASDPAGASTGIDCFGETVRHEDVHRDELHYWWDNAESGLGTFAIPPTECGWQNLTRNFYRQMSGLDTDLDMVPDYIERGLAGCDPDNPRSCPGRPFDDVGDVEMNAYRIGWKRWTKGSADAEDWSWCGKQWNDVSICQFNKNW